MIALINATIKIEIKQKIYKMDGHSEQYRTLGFVWTF